MGLATTTIYFERFYNLFIRMGALSNSGQQINMVQGDTGPILTFFLRDCDGNIISNVSGVNFYLKQHCGTGCPSNMGHTQVSGVNVSGGEWRYFFEPGDTSGVGIYFGDLEIVYDSGIVETGFDAVRLNVRKNNKTCD